MKMNNQAAETPEYAPPSRWSLFIGVPFFMILNSLHWAFVGGLGWGFGAAVGSFTPWADDPLWSGAIGLALSLSAVLTIGHGHQSERTPFALAMMGGAAFGTCSVTFLMPPGSTFMFTVGGVGGIIVAALGCLVKQTFAPVSLLAAAVIAVVGTGLFTAIGLMVGGPFGWTAAGGGSLFVAALLTEVFRRELAVEYDADDQPVRVILRNEMCSYVIRQSWMPFNISARGWFGAIAGLSASFWFSWVAEQTDPKSARELFLWCGGLAAFLILGTRFGLLKDAPASPMTKRE